MKKTSTLNVFLILFTFVLFISCSSDDETSNDTEDNEIENEPASSAKQMISFEFSAEGNPELSEDITATIDEEEKTITAIFPFDTDISSLTPSMEISPEATVMPTGAQDFSESITYSVTAEDESTAEYTTVIAVEGSDAKEITSFVFAAADNTELSEDITATIDEDTKTITATLPYATVVTALIPTIDVSMLATVSPTGVQDFSESITYTVTADDDSISEYTTEITIADQSPFVTTWKTTTDNESITIYINDEIIGYDYTIDWGDGIIDTNLTEDATHEYGTAGTYTVQILGDFPALYQQNQANSGKLLTIESWGDIEWLSMERAFKYCNNMTYNAKDIPNLSNVTNMAQMFYEARSFNGAIGNWDVSNVTTMRYMFSDARRFNQNINSWNVSGVTNMYAMFIDAFDFNQDIGSWDVSNVTDMANMFLRAYDFNGAIRNWDVSSVTNMYYMFYYSTSFNQDISIWNVNKVTSMSSMFDNANSFSQNLSNWDTSKVIHCSNFSSTLTAEELPTAGDCF